MSKFETMQCVLVKGAIEVLRHAAWSWNLASSPNPLYTSTMHIPSGCYPFFRFQESPGALHWWQIRTKKTSILVSTAGWSEVDALRMKASEATPNRRSANDVYLRRLSQSRGTQKGF